MVTHSADRERRAAEHALAATTVWSASERWSVLIHECGELLRPLSDISDLVDVKVAVSPRAAYLEGRRLWARVRVVKMLAVLAMKVAPEYRVIVVDAYRSIDYQRRRFEVVLEDAKRRYPSTAEDELRERVDCLVAIPETDPRKPPPHSTGGAIDMLLESTDSGEIDYGSRIGHFDDPEESDRHATNAVGLTPDQRDARVRLVTAAVSVGFASYPGEWWHFMFGDQEHALATGGGVAVYGRADMVAGPHVG